MCLRQGWPPVFIKSENSPFLDAFVGQQSANRMRSLFGQPVIPDNPYVSFTCDSGSYLTSTFSSLWSLFVLLAAFGAGLMFPTRKRPACWLLGTGAVVSVLDTGFRVYKALERETGHRGAAEFRTMVMHNLPNQMMANALFALALPFATAFALALFVRGLTRIVTAGWSRVAR